MMPCIEVSLVSLFVMFLPVLLGARHLYCQARTALLPKSAGAEQDSRADENDQQRADNNAEEAASTFVRHDEIPCLKLPDNGCALYLFPVSWLQRVSPARSKQNTGTKLRLSARF